MKIRANTEPTPVEHVSSTKGRAEVTPSSGGVRETRVELSRAARELENVAAPETADTARVERLRAVIADGSFKVDASAIADAMLREDQK